jgi:hypothetical protein
MPFEAITAFLIRLAVEKDVAQQFYASDNSRRLLLDDKQQEGLTEEDKLMFMKSDAGKMDFVLNNNQHSLSRERAQLKVTIDFQG